MRMSRLIGRRIKEPPRDASAISHIYLIRGGYVRPVSAGIYSLLPIGRKVTQKIEAVIREEMNAVGGQEVLLPVALPAELWKESGRYDSVGPELVRFQDRGGKEMVLGMTHEEAVVQLARTEISSYKQLPAMLYQIQTKFRDEARPRAGMIRVREFTMKDAYSFHADQECLEAYYEKCRHAYERIFARLGLDNVISIRSDAGMMGGKVAHEFMALADCGEDTIFLNGDGSYKANREVACSAVSFSPDEALALEKVHTPGQKSIEDVAAFLGVHTSQTGKAVFYADHEGKLVFAVIRGDFEVNETKLKNHLKTPVLRFATDDEIQTIGAVPGYASPMGVTTDGIRIVFDPGARKSSNLVVGANEVDYHYRNFNFDRDMAELAACVEVADIATAREGDPDPVHGKPLQMKRGIEVGNIFQLGAKYSESMGLSVLGKDGKRLPAIMGCYGIGIGRSMAAIIEKSHDKYGPIWPFCISPYELHICALNSNKGKVGKFSEILYKNLQKAGIDVLYDDRNEKPGFSFNDADLIGVPFRLIVSPKNMESGQVEFKTRDGRRKEQIEIQKVEEFITGVIKEARAAALKP